MAFYLYGLLGECKMKLVMVWMYFSVTAACVHGGQMPLWYIKDNQIQGLSLNLIKYNSKKRTIPYCRVKFLSQFS